MSSIVAGDVPHPVTAWRRALDELLTVPAATAAGKRAGATASNTYYNQLLYTSHSYQLAKEVMAVFEGLFTYKNGQNFLGYLISATTVLFS